MKKSVFKLMVCSPGDELTAITLTLASATPNAIGAALQAKSNYLSKERCECQLPALFN